MEKYRSLYQACCAYRDAVADDPLHAALLRALREDAQSTERCEDECSAVKWDPEWIEAFEAAMPYVVKAIDEQRRFIESFSEIRRVDQARKTTVDSVRHLAEHSNLISRVQGEDIIPEKILIVEREDNYAIYENRFLFTLVQQMHLFLNQRYSAAREANGLRRLRVESVRNAQSGDLRLSTSTSFVLDRLPARESRVLEEQPQEEMSDTERVEALYHQTLQLSVTPLLRQLKGCTPVSSPIVRTNVFKNNENFRQALNLFEFLQRYQKPGYEIITDNQTLPVFPESLRENLFELQLLQAVAGRLSMDPDLEEALKADLELTAAHRDLDHQQQDNALELSARSRIAQARREETAIRETEIARREEIIGQQDQEIARQRGEISDRDLKLEKAAEEIRGLEETREKLEQTVAEDQRILEETKEQARLELEKTVAEDQRVLEEAKEQARLELEKTVAEDQRILEEAKEQARLELEKTVTEDQRILEETKEQARLELEKTVAEDQRVLEETKEQARQELERTVTEDQRILEETKARAQHELDETVAGNLREREAAREKLNRLEESLHSAQEEARKAQSDTEAERLLRRQDLEQAKQEVLQARREAEENVRRIRADAEAEVRQQREIAEKSLQEARKQAEDALSRARGSEQAALIAQRQLREQKEKVASLQKQLIQARQSLKKTEKAPSSTRNLRHVARKVWFGNQKDS
ncbi:MAG: hypothetical protein K5922_04985 [Clostridiales bacterium]|nr:hypothetical protein [Clostridiales bacterium]